MGLEITCYHAPKLPNIVPAKIRESPSLSTCKGKIKTWHCDKYLCQLSKAHNANIVFYKLYK